MMTSHDSALPLFRDAAGIPAPIAAMNAVLISAPRLGATFAAVIVVVGLVGEEESPPPQPIGEISAMTSASQAAIRIRVTLSSLVWEPRTRA